MTEHTTETLEAKLLKKAAATDDPQKLWRIVYDLNERGLWTAAASVVRLAQTAERKLAEAV
jgi:hypothetical protein